MRHFCMALGLLWLAPAWAVEPTGADEGRIVIDVLTEADLAPAPTLPGAPAKPKAKPPVTLKRLAPKEQISFDDAVDMPSDI